MKRIILISVCFLFLLFSSCSNSSRNDRMSAKEADMNQGGISIEENGYTSQGFTNQVVYDRNTTESEESSKFENKGGQEENDMSNKSKTKIIKEGDVGIQVKNYADARKRIDDILEKYKAYIANENEQKTSYSIENRIVIRMPAEYFDTFVGEIGGIASKVDYKRVTAKDVTRQFVDIQSRLRTKKEVRTKYESFLVNAKNVKEMLEIEEKVRMLTEEIEAKEAELRYLSDKVSFSTITLQMTERLKYQYIVSDDHGPNFFQRLKKAFSQGWDGLLGLVIGLTTVWPLILIGIIIFLAIVRPSKSFLKRWLTKKN